MTTVLPDTYEQTNDKSILKNRKGARINSVNGCNKTPGDSQKKTAQRCPSVQHRGAVFSPVVIQRFRDSEIQREWSSYHMWQNAMVI